MKLESNVNHSNERQNTLFDSNVIHLKAKMFINLANNGSIDTILYGKCQPKEARVYDDDRAYDRMMKHDSPHVKDSAVVLHGIVDILRLEGKLDESYEFQEKKTFEVRRKFYSAGHTAIAASLNNLHSFLVDQGDYGNISSNHHMRSIQKDSYPPMHYEVADNMISLKIIVFKKGHYREFLIHLTKALNI